MQSADLCAAGSVLLLAPSGRDAVVIGGLLAQVGIDATPCNDIAALVRRLHAPDAGAALVAQEALLGDTGALRQWIADQPPWSDFPFILLTFRAHTARDDPRQPTQLAATLGNVTVLERPLHPFSLASAVGTALRARRRQREMLERERAGAALAQAHKMEAVGQLTGGVAHDFNNLLTVVLGSMQMIAKQTDDAQILRLTDNARRAAERGALLTQQLLAFSRRQRLTPAQVDLPRLIAGLGDRLTRVIGATVTLETRFAEELPPAFVDPAQMELVLLNLAANARDAMQDGGVLTIGGFALPSVPFELAEDLAAGSYVAIALTDTGSGMTPEVRDRAFEPFFTTKEPGKGTGLGLSQVYGFVRQSGGTVELRSAPGEGTAVTLYLPSAEAAPAAEAVERPEPPSQVRYASILVVDDDDDVRDLVVAMLEELGYRVTAAENGRAALELLSRDSRFDLLLTDVFMPGLSGIDVVHAVRDLGCAPRVLYATGFADLGAYRPGLEGEDMIRKPYRMADLAARVDRALRAPPGFGGPAGGRPRGPQPPLPPVKLSVAPAAPRH
jgi:signal transduction histidine kinase